MNTFGRIFKVSLFGESHGAEIGVVLDGVEPGIALCEKYFEADIARRRSGAKGTTPRIEADEPHILSGVFEGYTTGAPLTIVFRNTDTRSQDYARLKDVPRPGHADFTANVKYGGFQDPRGGGHFSGRLTLPIVAAGVVAKKILGETVAEETHGHVRFRCEARLTEVGGITDPARWDAALTEAQRDRQAARRGRPKRPEDALLRGRAHRPQQLQGDEARQMGDAPCLQGQAQEQGGMRSRQEAADVRMAHHARRPYPEP